ncbi:Nif3-like dinuclear metal center hexameric protein [Alteribacter lacisalsi]|nr:Nif3-like dinuclear metal center hexameric protein [Alteribacter lacisalsi]
MSSFLSTIRELFPSDVLDAYSDDWGVTYDAGKEFRRIGYATNLCPEVIRNAAASNVDLLLTHHDAWEDILFDMKEACLDLLKENGMSHFFVHGPLDFSWFGTAPSLIERLGAEVASHSSWKEQETPATAVFEGGISLQSLSDRMASVLGEPVRVWKNNSRKIHKAGVLTGAGNLTDHLKFAADEGCDAYITGEATLYSVQYAAFLGLNMVVGSHTFTEMFGVETFAKKVAWVHPEVDVVRIEERHLEADGITIR